jgi:Predicted ATPases of PP-loop superfamily
MMKYYINWSGGKDSSLCLYHSIQSGMRPEILLTSVNKTYDRISMHGVRRSLLMQQSRSLQIPLQTIELPEQPDMKEYEDEMNRAVLSLKENGFTHALFGDIFLEDLKKYREEQLKKLQIEPVFPIWKRSTSDLIREFLQLGFKAIVVCVNSKSLDKSFCGRVIDESFIQDYPETADICGENGEYHSFVYDGPGFSSPIDFTKGDIVYREYKTPSTSDQDCFATPNKQTGFYFCDLL